MLRGQDILSEVGQYLLRQARPAEFEIHTTLAAIVHDLDQQVVFALGQFQFCFLLIGGWASVGVIGQDLFAVEEHLDAVVAAQ